MSKSPIENIRNLYDKVDRFNDVQIILKDRYTNKRTFVNANKKILAMNSRYFKIMFEGNFYERNKKQIEIECSDVNIFQDIIKYFYCCDLPEYDCKNYVELMILKDFLQVELDGIKLKLPSSDREKICLLEELNNNNCDINRVIGEIKIKDIDRLVSFYNDNEINRDVDVFLLCRTLPLSKVKNIHNPKISNKISKLLREYILLMDDGYLVKYYYLIDMKQYIKKIIDPPVFFAYVYLSYDNSYIMTTNLSTLNFYDLDGRSWQGKPCEGFNMQRDGPTVIKYSEIRLSENRKYFVRYKQESQRLELFDLSKYVDKNSSIFVWYWKINLCNKSINWVDDSGNYIVISDRDTIYLLRSKIKDVISIGHNCKIKNIKMDKNNNVIVNGGKIIQIYDTNLSFKKTIQMLTNDNGRNNEIGNLEDFIVNDKNGKLYAFQANKILSIDIKTGKIENVFEMKSDQDIWEIKFSRDYSKLFINYYDNSRFFLSFFDIDDGKANELIAKDNILTMYNHFIFDVGH